VTSEARRVPRPRAPVANEGGGTEPEAGAWPGGDAMVSAADLALLDYAAHPYGWLDT